MIEKTMMVNGLDFKRKKMITMTKRKRTLVKREKKKYKAKSQDNSMVNDEVGKK
jgi:hypothetical protein